MIPELKKLLDEIARKNNPNRVHMFEGPEHVCGLSGFGQSLDDRCEACSNPICSVCGQTYSDIKHMSKYGTENFRFNQANYVQDLEELFQVYRDIVVKLSHRWPNTNCAITNDLIKQATSIVAKEER